MHPNQMPPQGGAVLNITTTKPFLAWMLAFTPPRLTLNGQESKLTWGQNQVPVPPGRYDLQVHVPYLWKIGQAGMQVDVHPGAQVPVFYAAPWWNFQPGAIAHQPVESPGKTAAIAVNIAAAVLLLLIIICGCAGALSGN
ncbi:hypothetical protein [Actinocatenispora rupis]|uniref:Uncharacterized protein n=1 Tax=Actinocatenispora rupis TaxID=519421 RepID=A0A8J3JC56_9ACTN|nr:hypothetical protein [Actinocatenispora rupis]GID13812.1 hypothetical protein Aru02nite_47010 [Actinocatenispora rupis]